MRSPVLTETPEAPAEEQRGGEDGIDWGRVRPGETFPAPDEISDDRCQLDDCDTSDRDVAPLWAVCPLGCGGD